MRFKEFLSEENRSTIFAEVRPVNDEELRLIKRAQQIAEIIHEMIKRGKKIDVKDVRHYQRELEQFSDEFKFLKRTTDEFKTWLATHEKMGAAAAHVDANIETMKSHYASLKDAFLSGKGDMEKHSKKLKKLLDPIDAHIDVSSHASRHIENVYKNKTTIFGTTRLLDNLDEADYEKIEKIDTTKNLYTALDFPIKKLKDDWDYIVFFLTRLSTQNQPIKFGADSHEFRTFMRVKMNGNDKFKKLLHLVDVYLHNNDKSLILEIVELINAIPQLKEANDKRKREIKKVYRGLGFGEDAPSENEIIEQDRKQKYVATSESLYAAKNFALEKGHLEGEDSRRSVIGYVIEYTVSPDAILFDTQVIDTAYNESEILIDATKAVAGKVREV